MLDSFREQYTVCDNIKLIHLITKMIIEK